MEAASDAEAAPSATSQRAAASPAEPRRRRWLSSRAFKWFSSRAARARANTSKAASVARPAVPSSGPSANFSEQLRESFGDAGDDEGPPSRPARSRQGGDDEGAEDGDDEDDGDDDAFGPPQPVALDSAACAESESIVVDDDEWEKQLAEFHAAREGGGARARGRGFMAAKDDNTFRVYPNVHALLEELELLALEPIFLQAPAGPLEMEGLIEFAARGRCSFNAELKSVGVAKLGHRYRIMRALAPFSELGMLGDSPDEQPTGQPECS